jgi:hypothetical protein
MYRQSCAHTAQEKKILKSRKVKIGWGVWCCQKKEAKIRMQLVRPHLFTQDSGQHALNYIIANKLSYVQII